MVEWTKQIIDKLGVGIESNLSNPSNNASIKWLNKELKRKRCVALQYQKEDVVVYCFVAELMHRPSPMVLKTVFYTKIML